MTYQFPAWITRMALFELLLTFVVYKIINSAYIVAQGPAIASKDPRDHTGDYSTFPNHLCDSLGCECQNTIIQNNYPKRDKKSDTSIKKKFLSLK